MHKNIKILFAIFLFNGVLTAQWESDVRLTNDSNVSFTTGNNAWAVAKSTNAINVVWRDNRFGNYNIFYKRSTNGGLNWGPDTRLTLSGVGRNPAIVASVQVLHIVWFDERDGNREIYYKRSTDEGNTWSTDFRLTNNSAMSMEPSISISGQTIHLTWYDTRDGNEEIYYKRSTDAGLTWGADIRLTNNSGSSLSPCITASGQIVHLVWYDGSFSGNKACYKRSTDAGITWSADTVLSSAGSSVFSVCLSSSGQNVDVVWDDTQPGNYEIYWMHSNNEGFSWNPEVRLTNDPAASTFPSVGSSNQNIHIVWMDNRDGNYEIYYKLSTNGGASWTNDNRITNDPGTSEAPSVSIAGSFVNVLWEDHRDGNWEVYFKQNPTGNLTGIQYINNEIPETYFLGQNYPNPFNPATKIKFSVPKSGKVSLKIMDVTGRIVQSLLNDKELTAGTYEYIFDGSNIASGIYFYSLYDSQKLVGLNKMVLLK